MLVHPVLEKIHAFKSNGGFTILIISIDIGHLLSHAIMLSFMHFIFRIAIVLQ